MSSKHGKGHRARWTDEKGKRQSRCFHLKRDASLFEMRKKAEVEIKAGLRAEKPTEHTQGADAAEAGVGDAWPDHSLSNYKGAALRLGIPLNTLYGLVHQGRIPHVRLGSRFVRFDPRDLEDWITSRKVASR